jgi:hypothetical protein
MGPFHNTQIAILGFHEFLKMDCAVNSNSEVKGHQKVTHDDMDGSPNDFDHFRFGLIPHSQCDPSSFLQDIPIYKVPFQT